MASLLMAVFACVPPASDALGQQGDLDREFKSAVALYDQGKYPDAAERLEKLVREVPQSFEVHELLGLVYAAESLNDKAYEHLDRAARLNPNSATAHNNLGNSLMLQGKADLAEAQFKKAVALAPEDYESNHNLGEFYARSNKLTGAIPFLERAERIDPTAYDNGYDLALAYLLTGRLKDARQLLQGLLARKDTAELHNLLGEVEEKDGKFVDAANEFEKAAHMDPSESNLFDWGSELLLHRTLEPAIEVYRQGVELHPESSRMEIGLGMAYYSLGKYDDAVKALLRAADLTPADPRLYPFLSRAFDSSPSQSSEVIERFRRFTELQPTNGRAFYYYALGLWKGKRAQDPDVDLTQVEALLKKSIALDPDVAEAQLQLGNLYSDERKYTEAVPYYVKARELNPDLADVHYRLGQAYVRLGEKEKAQEEIKIYQQLRAEHLSELEKQRAEIRQFVYSEQLGSPAKQ